MSPSPSADYEIVETRQGFRLLQHGCILSDVRTTPGPTHGFFDVLAAWVHTFAPGPDCLILGFAAGGILAPLQALGHPLRITAVDLDDQAYQLWKSRCDPAPLTVDFHAAEALAWSRSHKKKYDLILEDLSVPIGEDVFKPAISRGPLPACLHQLLRPGGAYVANLLKTADTCWKDWIHPQAGSARHVLIGKLSEHENRFLAVPRKTVPARTAQLQVLEALRQMRSRMEESLTVRTQTLVD